MKKRVLLAIPLLTAFGPPAVSAAESTLLVPPISFRGEADGAYSYAYNSTDGYVWAGTSSAHPGCMVAPVILEDGVTITGLSADLFDNLGSNFALQLLRHTLRATTPDAEVIAEVASTGASTSIVRKTTASITFGTVDNSQYAYYLSTATNCLAANDTGHRIYGARISHTELIFSDGFESGDTSGWIGSTSAHLVTIPAAGFFTHEVRSFSSSFYIMNSAGGYYQSINDSFPWCHGAPVELPSGAILVYMRTFLLDNYPAANLTVELRRKQFKTTAGATVIASVTTTGASPAVVLDVAGVSQPTIDNDNYTYYLTACFVGRDELRIYGVNLVYAY